MDTTKVTVTATAGAGVATSVSAGTLYGYGWDGAGGAVEITPILDTFTITDKAQAQA